MKYIVIILIVFINNVFSFEVEMKTLPERPLIDKNFEIEFKIVNAALTDVYIEFARGGIEVLARSPKLIVEKTQNEGGRIKKYYDISYKYKAITNISGIKYLRDIIIEVGTEQKSVKNFSFTVISSPPKPKSLFFEAITSKLEIFEGEGINVNYFLFYRIPVKKTELVKFPKLNRFIKRFHNISENPVVESYGDYVYKKSLKYSARLYPIRIGEVIVDPMRVKVELVRNGMRRSQIRDLSSKRVKIKVKKLPISKTVRGFTGLVGKHSFKMNIKRRQFAINEPVEMSLEVTGPGLLENYNAPVIYRDDRLESFDVKSLFAEIDQINAKKTFEYTFLGRSKIEIDKREMILSYFNPDTTEYVETTLNIPRLNISGVVSKKTSKKSQISGNKEKTPRKLKTKKYGIMGPYFKKKIFKVEILVLFNVILGCIMVLIISWLYAKNREKVEIDDVQLHIKNMKKHGITYSRIHQLIYHFIKGDHSISIQKILTNLDLKEESKNYFTNLILATEADSYSRNDGEIKVKFSDRHFNELTKLLEEYENNKQY